MPGQELARWVVLLGREFGRRGMVEHARLLRVYYLALKHRLLVGNRSLEISWTEEMVKDWLAVFRLPPFAERYLLLPRDAPCPKCGRRSHNGKYTLMTFPGGHKSACRNCGAQWLTLNDEPSRFGPRISLRDKGWR